MAKSLPSESISLSFDDMCLLLQLVDMATSALDSHDFVQLDTVLRKIRIPPGTNMQTRILSTHSPGRRDWVPAVFPVNIKVTARYPVPRRRIGKTSRERIRSTASSQSGKPGKE